MTVSLARNTGNLSNILTATGSYAVGSTPAELDASGNLATTKFAKLIGANYSAILTVTATSTLALTSLGRLTLINGSGITLTFPAVATCPAGSTLSFFNATTGSVTLKGNSAEFIISPVVTTGANTLTLYAGEGIQLTSTGTQWVTAFYNQVGSPTFSGTPKLLTNPAILDNSLLIPSTSWVNTRGFAFSPATTLGITATVTTLTTADAGSMKTFSLLGAQSVVLPATAGLLSGTTFRFAKYGSDYTAHQLTVTTNSSTSTISYPGAGTLLSVLYIQPGENVDLTWDGTYWRIGGSRGARANIYKVGEVKMWHGTLANVSVTWGAGWQLANGTNGTANLTDRCIVGAGNLYTLNLTGGSTTNTLSTAQLPSHTHGVTDPGHAHSVADGGHAHAVADAGHAHSTWGPYSVSGQSDLSHDTSDEGDRGVYNGSWTAATSTSGTGIGIYAAATGIGIYGATTGISIQATGSGSAVNNMQPYYALAFIEYTGIGT